MPLVLSALLLGGCGETTFSSTTTGTSSSSSSANTTSSNSEGTSSAPSSTSSSSSIAKVHCAFYNWDEETLLWSTDIKKGREVVYDGPVPTRDSSAQYSYAFKGWDKDLAGIEADTDFIAQYDRSLNQYNVSFVSDGAVLESQKVAYGAKAVYHGATPSKATTAQYTYAFSGWDKDPTTTTISADTIFTAQFSNTVNSYTASFYYAEGDITPVYTVSVPYGSYASYQGKALTKDSTAEYSYEFAGWDKDPASTPITDNIRFNAVFKASILSYTASFYQESDDTTPLYSVLLPYGSYATYQGEEPKKAVDERYAYTFQGWDKDPATTRIEGNTNFYAQFSYTGAYHYTLNSSKNLFTDGTNLQSDTLYADDSAASAVVSNGFTHYGTALKDGSSFTMNSDGYLYNDTALGGLTDVMIQFPVKTSVVIYMGWNPGVFSQGPISLTSDANGTLHFNFTDSELFHADWKEPSYFKLMPKNTSITINSMMLYYTRHEDQTTRTATFNFELTVDKDAYTLKSFSTSNCHSSSVVIPDTYNGLPVTAIGKEALRDKGLRNVVIPSSVIAIEESAFANNDIANLAIPGNVKRIGKGAFQYSTIDSLSLGEGITTIEDAAFAHDTIASVTLPASLASLGVGVFKEDASLLSFNVAEGNTSFSVNSDHRCLLSADGKILYAFAPYKREAYEFPTGIETVLAETFLGWSAATSVTFQNGLKTIGNYACAGLTSLSSVSFGNTLTTIEDNAFNGCKKLVLGTLPKSLITIGAAAFYGNETNTSLTFETGSYLDSIGNEAFKANIALTSVTLPDLLNRIGDYAFQGDKALTNLIIPENSLLTHIGTDAFRNCSAIAEINFPESSALTELGTGVFSDDPALKKITFPKSLTITGESLFARDTALTGIVLMGVPQSFYPNSFEGCSSFTYNYTSTDTTTRYIGNTSNPYLLCVGTGDTSITSLTLASTCKGIVCYAFTDTTSITEITIDSELERISAHAFDGVSSLKTIHFANNATSHLAWIDEYAFACSEGHLANVILPYGNRSDGTANAITIGYHAFANGSGAGTGASKNYIVYESGHIVAGAFSGFDYYSILLFHGTKSDWQKFENYQNAGIDVAYYLEVQPTDKANTYWHFDGSNPTIWVVK